jgi:DNA polymerase II small subunit/DNA polymerase delta subunit B
MSRLTYLGTVLMSEESARLQQQNPQKHFIAGSDAEIIGEIERFSALGVTQFIFRMNDLETAWRFVADVARTLPERYRSKTRAALADAVLLGAASAA